MEQRAALLEAGPARLRPILMTSTTIAIALFPTALRLGEGAELRAPLAAAVLGGVISSTLLTLVLVPVVYTLLDGAPATTGRIVRRAFGVVRSRRPAAPSSEASGRGDTFTSTLPAPASNGHARDGGHADGATVEDDTSQPHAPSRPRHGRS
jgi:HAE1 family hydrophobic/amphiphilic exporter-1